MQNKIKARILVVDDDPTTLKLTCQILTTLGYETTAAQNGAKALKLIANQDGFHLILTDINMPNMNGWELALLVKKINASIPIIALTGEYPNSILPHLKGSAIKYALFKPLSITQLKHALAYILDPEMIIIDRDKDKSTVSV